MGHFIPDGLLKARSRQLAWMSRARELNNRAREDCTQSEKNYIFTLGSGVLKHLFQAEKFISFSIIVLGDWTPTIFATAMEKRYI